MVEFKTDLGHLASVRCQKIEVFVNPVSHFDILAHHSSHFFLSLLKDDLPLVYVLNAFYKSFLKFIPLNIKLLILL